MPLSFKDFTELLRGLPKDADEATVNAAAQHAEAGTPLQKIWEWANRPLVGSPDALIPGTQHTHSADESMVRRVAEDVGSSLTSPVSLGTTALGVGAAAAGAKGLLGLSRAARVGEALLQAPLAAEGAKQIVEGNSVGEKLGGVVQAGLATHGIKSALGRTASEIAAPVVRRAESEILPQGEELALGQRVDSSAIGHTPASGASLLPQPSAAPSLQLSPELLADVNSRHLSSGGSTTNIVEGKGLGPQDARFVFSPYRDREIILDQPPTEQDLRNFVAKNEDLLSKPGHNLGTWDNEGKHYLDVSIGENDLPKALALAKQHNQLAIFDMANGKDIKVPSVDHAAAEASNIARNAPYGEGSIMPSNVTPTERLYRGEPEIPSRIEPSKDASTGRWFTSNPEQAKQYAGGKGKVYVVDLDKDYVKDAMSENAPSDRSVLLNAPEAKGAKPLSDDELRNLLGPKPTKAQVHEVETKTGKKFSAKDLTRLLRKNKSA